MRPYFFNSYFDFFLNLIKELGPGPYTAEQQKLKDSYISYLSKESVQYSIPSHVNLNQNASMATSSNSQTTEANNTTTGQQSSFVNQNQVNYGTHYTFIKSATLYIFEF